MALRRLALIALATVASVAPMPVAMAEETGGEPICGKTSVGEICIPNVLRPNTSCWEASEGLDLFWCYMKGTGDDVREGDLQCDYEQSFIDGVACEVDQ